MCSFSEIFVRGCGRHFSNYSISHGPPEEALELDSVENGTRAPILAKWPTHIAQNMEDLFAGPGILFSILSDIQAYYQYNFHVLNNFDIESDIAKK